jgi:hypothetical protein
MCVSQILPNLKKRPPYPQVTSKLSEIFFLVKDLTNQVLFSQDQSFGEHTFLTKMDNL